MTRLYGNGSVDSSALNRIVVTGASGSGKTFLAMQIAERLDLPHVELDALHWEPNWQMVDRDVFRSRVDAALSGDRWVTDGNYSKTRDIVWGRAQSIVFLDYPRMFVLARLVHRTVIRIATRKELWAGNRETIRDGFLDKDAIVRWMWKTHPKYRREYPALLGETEFQHLKLVHLRSPAETTAWLKSLG